MSNDSAVCALLCARVAKQTLWVGEKHSNSTKTNANRIES